MNSWVRGRAGVVTFKLETDPGLLLEKARKALDRSLEWFSDTTLDSRLDGL